MVLGTVALMSGCNRGGYTRDEVRDRWVRTFAVRYGMLEETAGCVVDGFFGDLDDDELRPLTNGTELSDAQAARVTELLDECGFGATSTRAPA
jgi:hypothetical protein